MSRKNKNRQRRAILFVQHYRPGYEAVSNEIEQLTYHLSKEGWKVKIHDLHFQNLFRFKFNQKIISYHFAFYPLTFILVYFYSLLFDVRHIFTSLCDTPYLFIINKKPLLLTAAAPYNLTKLKKRINNLKKVTGIILENKIQEKHLNKNIMFNRLRKNNTKIPLTIIYPGVDLNKFYYQKPKEYQNKRNQKSKYQGSKFTILFASSPKDPNRFRKRGVYLMLEAAKEMKNNNIKFDFSWMTSGPYLDSYLKIKNLIDKNKINNIKITNKFVKNMNDRFSQAHCTIIPYTEWGDFVKLTPNSALESLAAGKPVLCSSKSGIAKIIHETKTGIVFEPNKDSLTQAIKKLEKNYHHYQKNCRKTAEKMFSKNIFETRYGEIYKQLR